MAEEAGEPPRTNQHEDLLHNGAFLLKKSAFGKRQRFVWCPANNSSINWCKKDLLDIDDDESKGVPLVPNLSVLEHLDRTGSCKKLLVTQIQSVQPVPRGDDPSAFVITPRDADEKPLTLKASDAAMRDKWVKAITWIKDNNSAIGMPYNVQHRAHVNVDMNWTAPSGDNIEDQFVLEDLIGTGGFGKVYTAVHKDSYFKLAIKLALFDSTVVSLEELKAEVDILKVCRDENIVAYYGCWGPDSKSVLWILMELCEGGSVIDLMEKQNAPLNEAQIAFVCGETLRALQYLHRQRNIIHRDIKGRNILLTKQGTVKLTDFGLSQKVDTNSRRFWDLSKVEGHQEEYAAGSPHWMAPEVVSRKGHVFKSDIWSLGITAIELTQGDPPRGELSPYKVMVATVKDPPPTLPIRPGRSPWSLSFQDFVEKCLTKDARERPSVDLMLLHPFITGAPTKSVMAPLIYQALFQGMKHSPADISASMVLDSNGAPRSKTSKEDIKKAKEIRKEEKKAARLAEIARLRMMHRTAKTVKDYESERKDLQFFDKIAGYELAEEQKKQAEMAESAKLEPKFDTSVVFLHDVGAFRLNSTIPSPAGGAARSFVVERKIADFKWLQQYLLGIYKFVLVPPVPSSGSLLERGTQAEEAHHRRRFIVQQFLRAVARHQALGTDEAVMEFISADPKTWRDSTLSKGSAVTTEVTNSPEVKQRTSSSGMVNRLKELKTSLSRKWIAKGGESNDIRTDVLLDYASNLVEVLQAITGHTQALTADSRKLAQQWLAWEQLLTKAKKRSLNDVEDSQFPSTPRHNSKSMPPPTNSPHNSTPPSSAKYATDRRLKPKLPTKDGSAPPALSAHQADEDEDAPPPPPGVSGKFQSTSGKPPAPAGTTPKLPPQKKNTSQPQPFFAPAIASEFERQIVGQRTAHHQRPALAEVLIQAREAPTSRHKSPLRTSISSHLTKHQPHFTILSAHLPAHAHLPALPTCLLRKRPNLPLDPCNFCPHFGRDCTSFCWR